MALRRFGAAIATLFVIGAALVPTLRSQSTHPAVRQAAAPTSPSPQVAVKGMPLSFLPAGRNYVARGPGYAVELGAKGMKLALQRGDRRAAVVGTQFVGAAHVRPVAEGRQPGVVNIYHGPTVREGIHTFGRVRYASVYPGIDALFHGRGSTLEYDLAIHPGADPRQVVLSHTGVRSLTIARNGDLLLHVPGGVVRQARPVAYQSIGGRRVHVDASYTLTGRRIGFKVGSYDRSRELVIDPVLGYSSYFGGSGDDTPFKITRAADGSVYIAGSTTSNDLLGSTRTPTDYDAFAAKLNPDGSKAYATYIGTTATEYGSDIATDSSGRAYVVGLTESSSFATTTPDVTVDDCDYAPYAPKGDAFIVRLTAAGTVNYKSCISGAGTDYAAGVAIREAGGVVDAYVAGSSYNTAAAAQFPTTNGFQTSADNSHAWFVKVHFGATTTMPYATFIDGEAAGGTDSGNSVAVDSAGNAYVAVSSNSPKVWGADKTKTTTTNSGVIVVKIDPSQSGAASKVYATWIDGSSSDDVGNPDGGSYTGNVSTNGRIAVNSSNMAYVVGRTLSSDLPGKVTSDSRLADGAGFSNGFIGVVGSDGSVLRTIYVGGSGEVHLSDLALQEVGGVTSVVAVGDTDGFTGFNTLSGHSCSTTANTPDVLLVRVADGAAPTGIYATCLHGSGADSGTGVALARSGGDATVWLTGAAAAGFPTVNPQQDSPLGGQDGFVAKIALAPSVINSGPDGAILGAGNPATFTFSNPDGLGFACSVPAGGKLVAGNALGSCSGSGTTTYSGLADGEHTFEVASADAGGGQSARVSRSFTVDTTPPGAFDLVSPAEGEAVATAKPSFSWAKPTDASAVTYELQIDDQKFQDVPGSACTNGTCTVQAANEVPGGPHSWKVVAVDSATPANRSTSTSTRTVNIPGGPNAAYVIAPNPVLVGRAASFDASSSTPTSGTITRYEWDLDGDGSFETDGGSSPTTSHIYTAAGTVNTALRVTDSKGGKGIAKVALRVSDPLSLGNQVGVSINKGAQYTNKPDVTLTIVAPSNANALLISNDGGFVGALPQAVQKEVAWKLDSSGPERLPKTVYLRFLVNTFASSNYTDDIILDERPPVVDAASVATAASSSSAATAAKAKTYKVKVKAHDTNSGVGGVQVTINKRKPGKLLKYKRTVSVKLASRPKFIRAKDRAGNYSRWRKLK